MQPLASRAMAILGIQRLIPTQLIMHFSTMTMRLQLNIKLLAFIAVLVDLIRRLELPFVQWPIDGLLGVALGLGLLLLLGLWWCHGERGCGELALEVRLMSANDWLYWKEVSFGM